MNRAEMNAMISDPDMLAAQQALAPQGFVVQWARKDGSYSESRDGIDWLDAPVPPWDHKCSAQTNGWLGMNQIQRCACGATRFNGGEWRDRNQTRTSRGEQPPAHKAVRRLREAVGEQRPPLLHLTVRSRLARFLVAAGAQRADATEPKENGQ